MDLSRGRLLFLCQSLGVNVNVRKAFAMDLKSVYLLTTFEGVAGLANFLASRAAILVGCARFSFPNSTNPEGESE